jgi:hypothetical protein
MELGTFTPRENTNYGDQFPAKEAADRPLVVLVREHRTGIVTKFKPEGGEGVIVDAADVRTDETWLDVLWMNGAIVDNLTSYLGQPVAIKIVWTASKSGGNAYLSVEALEGQELAMAQQWAKANPSRFETERATRATQPTTSAPVTALPSVTPPAATAAPDPAKDPQVLALLAQLQAQQAKVS